MVRPLQAAAGRTSTAMHIQKVDTLGFPTVQTDWKNSTLAPSYPPGTSGNPVVKKNFFVIFLTNLQPMMVRPLQAGVRRPSTAMHIQKIDTLGFPTVQTDWKNSTVAPSYSPRYFWQPGSEKKFCHFFDLPPIHDGPTAPVRCGTAWHSNAYSTSRHFGLSNGPNGLEKLHGGAKLPPQHLCTMVCQKHCWVQ